MPRDPPLRGVVPSGFEMSGRLAQRTGARGVVGRRDSMSEQEQTALLTEIRDTRQPFWIARQR